VKPWAGSWRDVDVWWEGWSWRPRYQGSYAYHRVYLPTGLVVRWTR
jgi:hypothetical protein